MYFEQIYERKLSQYAYLIGCQQTGEAILVDPMRDVDRYLELAAAQNLEITAAADTHIHADYLTGLRELAERGVTVYASGEGGEEWQYEWLSGSGYDYRLLGDHDEFEVGNIRFRVLHTPGHTPEHLSYLVTDGAAAEEPMGLLSGDFVFVGDLGRPDLLESAAGQEGSMQESARMLYRSVDTFRELPEYLQVWPGHGAGSACGKALGAVPETTVGYELRYNPALRLADCEDGFVDYILDGQPEPPLYFARMKRDNREGPPLLDGLPRPRRMEVAELARRLESDGAAVLDTRGRDDFMEAHLPGSLHVPFNRQFNTIAGSYVEEGEDIFLLMAEEQVEEAVRDLVRVGLDRVAGYAIPAELQIYADTGGRTKNIPTADFTEVRGMLKKGAARALDVRSLAEFREGHIDGAVNIAHTRLKDRLVELDRATHWLVHCRTGARASAASSLLERKGYTVTYVNDLIERWEDLVKEG